MTKHILIVEDSPVISKVQRMILENLGVDVDCAMTGEEGVALAHEKQYDLILMDIGLPGIDGLETTKKIKMDESGIDNTNTPIVAVTANEAHFIRELCLQAGMTEVLTKPFTSLTARELLTRFYPELIAFV